MKSTAAAAFLAVTAGSAVSVVYAQASRKYSLLPLQSCPLITLCSLHPRRHQLEMLDFLGITRRELWPSIVQLRFVVRYQRFQPLHFSCNRIRCNDQVDPGQPVQSSVRQERCAECSLVFRDRVRG